MVNQFLRWAGGPVWQRLKARIDRRIDERLGALQRTLPDESGRRVFIPPCPPLWDVQTPFMAHSTCSSADLMHPEYIRYCDVLGQMPVYHRKVWEWVFVMHHLSKAGVLREGCRGIGFGVGQERLPAWFASLGAEVLATDAPSDVGVGSGWAETREFSDSREQLFFPHIVAREAFDARVRHAACDMNAIPADIGQFDFTWSCCSFEHLGSLEAGMHFVVESVEKALKVGGIACHTTEFNVSSNDETVESGPTVLYRKRDMEELVRRLRERGHEVQPFVVAPDSHYLDGFVDVPPYTHNPHLKLLLAGYITTSAGIVVRRGR